MIVKIPDIRFYSNCCECATVVRCMQTEWRQNCSKRSEGMRRTYTFIYSTSIPVKNERKTPSDWLIDRLTSWLNGWMIDWLTHSLSDWLTNQPTNLWTKAFLRGPHFLSWSRNSNQFRQAQPQHNPPPVSIPQIFKIRRPPAVPEQNRAIF